MKPLNSLKLIISLILLIATTGRAQNPVADFVAADSILCGGGSAIDFINNSTNATSYIWYFEGGRPSSSTVANYPGVVYDSAGVFDVTLIAINGSNRDTLTKTNYIIVYPHQPSPSFKIYYDSIYVVPNPAYLSYQWYHSGTIIPGATKNYYAGALVYKDSYSCKTTDTNGCSVNWGFVYQCDAISFNVNRTPCTSEYITFTNTTVGGNAFLWLLPGSNMPSTSTFSPFNVRYNNVGTYDVTVIAYDYGCIDTLVLKNYITVKQGITAPTISRTKDTLYCSNDTSYHAWQWYRNSVPINGATKSSLTVSTTGTYVVSASGSSGCSNTASFSVVFPPTATFSLYSGTICKYDNVFFNNYSQDATSYKWYFPGGTPSVSTMSSPQVYYLSPGTYDATLIAYNTAGSDTLTLANCVKVNPSPPAPVITGACGGTLTSSVDTSYKSYQWYFNYSQVTGATNSSYASSSTGTYEVHVKDGNNCGSVGALACLPPVQAGRWIWLHGDSAANSDGYHNTRGTPDTYAAPPAVYEPCQWTDKEGKFWLYGGVIDLLATVNDLWKYDPVSNEWTWVHGTHTYYDPGDYGLQGVPSGSNRPSARSYGSATWVDQDGDLWMFGGHNQSGDNSDLWRYTISTNMWTWLKGPSTTNQAGIYGTLGVPGAANNPGGREEVVATWADNEGNLWLFGGINATTLNSYNDLWRYNIASNTWTWMKGSQYSSQVDVYGTQGVESPANTPGARAAYSTWKDNSGNFWLFGGWDLKNHSSKNDLWRYNPVSNNWAWISGGQAGNEKSTYGNKCILSAGSAPGARFESRTSWTDSNGNFWLFGGVINNGSDVDWNDLWMYCVSSNKWVWVSGDSTGNPQGHWGSKGVYNPLNIPNGRNGAVPWYDGKGNLYLFGGNSAPYIDHNDLWKYTIDYSCINLCPGVIGMADYAQADNAIRIYPNPAKNNLTIDAYSLSGKSILRIYDMLGKELIYSVVTDSKTEIDISSLRAGIYFVLMNTSNSQLTGRFVKE